MKSPVSFVAFLLAFFICTGCRASNTEGETAVSTSPATLWGDYPNLKPECVKGIHLTAWAVASKKSREYTEKLLAETELNTVVIDVKEVNGEVYIPGVKLDKEFDVYTPAFTNISDYLKKLKAHGVYTIARIVVFKDTVVPKNRPDWAVRSSTPLPKAMELGFDPHVWVDYKGMTWSDPFNPQVWKYNIDIAERAAELGFQEVQFDYIRFPSDGDTDLVVYSKPHTKASSVHALAMFLKRARERLHPHGVPISIDVFGLAGSYNDGLGIGQKLDGLMDDIETLSPMKYPSHYARGEYGFSYPNAMPYETVLRSTKDTLAVIGSRKVELRPWIQDFSLGVKYTPDHVRAQIEALADQGIYEWMLWNPSCRYTREALNPAPGN